VQRGRTRSLMVGQSPAAHLAHELRRADQELRKPRGPGSLADRGRLNSFLAHREMPLTGENTES